MINIYIKSVVFISLNKVLAWKQMPFFVNVPISFNHKFFISVFSTLYLPIYSLSPLMFHSVKIKNLAIKHLETSAVKI